MKKVFTYLVLFTFVLPSVAQQFQQYGMLIKARSSLESVYRNGKLYCIGGQTIDPTGTPVFQRAEYMDVFDLENGVPVSQSVQQDNVRWWPAIVAGDSGVYVFGGFNLNVDLRKSAVVYKDDMRWYDIDSVPGYDQNFLAKAIYVNGKIILGSGVITSYQDSTGKSFRQHSSSIYIYDEASKVWTTKNLSTPRYSYSMVSHENKVYFIGGFVGPYSEAVSDVIDVYDLSNDTWETKTLPSARGNMATVVSNGKIFVAGGIYLDGSGNWLSSDALEIYDITQDSWDTSKKLINARSYIQAAALFDEVIFYGGASGFNGHEATDYSTSGSLDIYDVNSGDWKVQSFDEELIRCYFAMSVSDDAVYVSGGYYKQGGNTAYHQSVRIYSPYLGIDDFMALNSLKIYPNPSQNYLNIDGIQSDINYEIIDPSGRINQSGFLSIGQNQIDVSSIQAGIYFLKIGEKIERIMIE